MKAFVLVLATGGLMLLSTIALVALGAPVHALAIVPLGVCLAMHLWMGHGDPDGAKLLETARKAGSTEPR